MDTKYLIIGLLAILVPVASGCDDGKISKKKARTFVDSWAQTAEESLDEHVPAEDAVKRFETIVKKDATAEEESVSRSEPPYDAFIRDVYADLGWKLRLASDEGLTERGDAIWKILRKSDEHALDLGDFEFDAIRKHLERIEKLDKRVGELDSYALSDRERKAAVAWLTKRDRKAFELTPDNYDKLVEAVVDSEAGDRLADHMEKLERVYNKRADAVAGLEQLLARNTVRYSRKMKHFRIRHVWIHPREEDYWDNFVIRNKHPYAERPDEAEAAHIAGGVWREAAKTADKLKEPVAILHRRMRETLREVLTADDPANVLENLAPDHPQYAKLKNEYARYREIVEEGGWERVEPDKYLDRGETDETAAALKKRLKAEDYYPADADTDDEFDETLEKAIEKYQTTHQMRVTGEPHAVFWSSINKDAEFRKQQLGLNLKRWRESNVRHSDPTYVMVNIPGFTVSLYHQQKRRMHFGIVVGNDDLKVKEDERGRIKEKLKPNHTPELSAYIDRVIYNPFWNVTDRIRNGEILPKVRHSVETKYKAKLRELRKTIRRSKRADASHQSTKSGDKYLVAANTEGSTSDSSGGGASSGSDVSGGPMAGPGAGGADGESVSADTSEGANRQKKKNGDATKNGKETAAEEPKVDISDLFRMVDVQNQADEVDQRAIFDVQKVRKLVKRAEEIEANKKKKAIADPTGGEMFGSGMSSKAAANRAKASETTSEAEESGENKSALEKTFPYLDPKTGKVDVSSTDPDNIPKWYEEHDYEVKFPGKDWEYVRETQGDHNALGRVKVIFPNQHAVYLHDTPKKSLFSRKIRAFSHGCMRMSKPLQFAAELLKIDGSFDEVNVPKLLEGEEKPVKNDEGEKTGETEMKYTYKPVFLDKQVPVHIDYFTVLVGDEGRANFYADIYNKDKRKLIPDYVPETKR